MINFKYFLIEQPVGKLYLGSLSAKDIDKISASYTRSAYNQEGIQRKIIESRKKEIATYAKSDDAIFPTPIVLSASSKYIDFIDKGSFLIDSSTIKADGKFFSIIDGQHRLAGIKEAGMLEEFTLPVIIILDTYEYQDAEIFVAINGNQRSVSKSLLYDLFGLSEKRTVEKVCHTIIKALNKDEDSRIRHKIKMLGYRDEESKSATVSQATMVDSLKKLITNNSKKDNLYLDEGRELVDLDDKKYVFRKYFKNQDDSMIYVILKNYFNAWTRAKDKANVEGIPLDKSIGYMASFYLLRAVFLRGLLDNDASEERLYEYLSIILQEFYKSNATKTYSSSESGAKKLFIDLVNAAMNSDIFNKEFLDKYAKSLTIEKWFAQYEEDWIYEPGSSLQTFDELVYYFAKVEGLINADAEKSYQNYMDLIKKAPQNVTNIKLPDGTEGKYYKINGDQEGITSSAEGKTLEYSLNLKTKEALLAYLKVLKLKETPELLDLLEYPNKNHGSTVFIENNIVGVAIKFVCDSETENIHLNFRVIRDKNFYRKYLEEYTAKVNE